MIFLHFWKWYRTQQSCWKQMDTFTRYVCIFVPFSVLTFASDSLTTVAITVASNRNRTKHCVIAEYDVKCQSLIYGCVIIMLHFDPVRLVSVISFICKYKPFVTVNSLIITRVSEVIMFSPCVFVCLFVSLSRCLSRRFNYEGLVPRKQYFAGWLLGMSSCASYVSRIHDVFHDVTRSQSRSNFWNWYISVNIWTRASIKSSKYRKC